MVLVAERRGHAAAGGRDHGKPGRDHCFRRGDVPGVRKEEGGAGAAGCNLEDTDHASGGLRDPDQQAEWLGAVRKAASDDGYGLVINARIDVFLGPLLGGAGPGTQEELVPEALRRASAYFEAGVDCVYPLVLWETDALRRFASEARGPVNVVRMPPAPSLAELAEMGVARVSWGHFLYQDAMVRFGEQLASLQPQER